MTKLIFLLFTTLLLSKSDFDNSFITKYEYGKMLYANPRGISCIKCHGKDAKGKKIATFTHIRNKIKYNCTIQSNDITDISYKNFLLTLDPKLEKTKKKMNCCKTKESNIYNTYQFPVALVSDEHTVRLEIAMNQLGILIQKR